MLDLLESYFEEDAMTVGQMTIRQLTNRLSGTVVAWFTDQIQQTGQNPGQVFNFRSGKCVLRVYTELRNLKLKTQP